VAGRPRDFYEVLGVGRSSSDKEIRAAYRKLARQFHPDLNPGDKTAESRFKEIQQAYEVLSDAQKRKKYDQFGADFERASQAPPSGFEGFGTRTRPRTPGETGIPTDFGDLGTEEGMDFGDILGRVFGGFGGSGGSQARARRGRDLEQPVSVSLEEAFAGTARLIEMRSEAGETKRLEVKIPPGVRDGSRIRVAGEGGPGVGGGPRGDLFLVTSIKPHPSFERKGDDIHLEAAVPLTVAVLGGEAPVQTLKGRIALKIPPETQNGQVIRLGGLGMPHLGDKGRGDAYAKVRVVLPTNLTSEEREKFVELQLLRASD
jgi:DnaJ-class molecular chaperone